MASSCFTTFPAKSAGDRIQLRRLQHELQNVGIGDGLELTNNNISINFGDYLEISNNKLSLDVESLSSKYRSMNLLHDKVAQWLSNAEDASNNYGDISTWDVSGETNMRFLFLDSDFNEDISNWDTKNVTDMVGMFQNAYKFNRDISSWDVSQVTSMKGMFTNAYEFNNDLSWNVDKVTNMEGMFENAQSFNGDISSWNVGNVTSMKKMFMFAENFDQDLSWNVSNVKDMEYMFFMAKRLNQDISWALDDTVDLSNVSNIVVGTDASCSFYFDYLTYKSSDLILNDTVYDIWVNTQPEPESEPDSDPEPEPEPDPEPEPEPEPEPVNIYIDVIGNNFVFYTDISRSDVLSDKNLNLNNTYKFFAPNSGSHPFYISDYDASPASTRIRITGDGSYNSGIVNQQYFTVDFQTLGTNDNLYYFCTQHGMNDKFNLSNTS